MSKPSFFRSLSPHNRYVVGNLFFLFLVQGIFLIGIGSLLPLITADYGLSYHVGGYLLSAHSIGTLLTGLVAGSLAGILGLKRALLLQNILPYIGFALTLVTGNPALLIFAFLFTGLGRGAVSNYNNQLVSSLSGGDAAPLNALHGFFAIGAVSVPVLILICTKSGDSGWRYAVWVIIALGLMTMVTSALMKMDNVSYAPAQSGKPSLDFFKDRPFVRSALMMFFYLSVESAVMGWLVTYYIDTGAATQEFAQVLTSLLWIVILVGRFGCGALSTKISTPPMILTLCVGIVTFLTVLLMSRSLVPMLVGTVGLGLSLSGMYGTTMANAGTVFQRYPLAMGVFITLTGISSVVTPSIIGTIAGISGIQAGMSVLLVPALLLAALAVWNLLAARKAVRA